MSNTGGQQGTKVADETKGIFKAVGDMGEDLRKNINSFADNLVGGVKQTDSSVGGSSSGGVHPDVKKTEDSVRSGVDSAGKKIDQVIDQNKQKH